SECKPSRRDFPSSSHTVPASGCSTPDALSPSLMVEDEVFFGTMAEERENDSSSLEHNAGPDATHSSSMEDLLSIDSSLHGSEYYKDLGLSGPTETTDVAKLQPEWAPSFASSIERAKGGGVPATWTTTLGLETTSHFLDESHVCSCSSGGRGPKQTPKEEEEVEGEAFPGLEGSLSTSQWHSWEMRIPMDTQHRFSLHASEEPKSDTEKEEGEEKTLLQSDPSSVHSHRPGQTVWSGGQTIQVKTGPLDLETALVLEANQVVSLS
ncbi:hypothetical protein JD844_033926, partial [Phrynosoma platyrhinos]